MATTKQAAQPSVDVAKQLKEAVGVFTASQKQLVAKDKTIAKLNAQIAKLQAKAGGGVQPAVKRAGRKASADDADVPTAKRVKATPAPAAAAATEPKKRGPKPKVAAPVVEQKKRGPKPKVAAPVVEPKKRGPKPKAEAVAPQKKGKKSDEDFLV